MNDLQPSLQHLASRSSLLKNLRRFFDDRGFLEVQPPCLSRDSVVDAYLDPVRVNSDQFRVGLDLPSTYELQTSPESAMKRMLAAGAPSIYSIGPVFRAGERGDLHNLEFTMLEWYDVGADMSAEVALLGNLAAELVGADGYSVMTYRELFQEKLGLDPIEANLAELFEVAKDTDIDLARAVEDDRDSLLDIILSHQLQPALGIDRPLILTHYPVSQAALAKPAADDPLCAARFELFVAGMELANGYDELLDVGTLIERYHSNNARRRAAGRPPMNVDTSLVASMRRGIPPCAGVALGVDRLLMAVTGAQTIEEVMPFPIERA